MYQGTADILNHNINSWWYLYREAIQSTDWCILTEPGTIFMFPGGLVDVPEVETMGNYRYSGYRCPECGRALYKTVFPEGNEPYLIFNDETQEGIEPTRIFTCPDCLSYYAVQRGQRLLDGTVVSARFPKTEQGLYLYNTWFVLFNDHGDLNAKRSE